MNTIAQSFLPTRPPMRRIRPSRVAPLEIWDLLANGSVISERMDDPDFPALLARAIRLLGEGIGRTRAPTPPSLLECRGARFVYVGGGRPYLTSVAEALACEGLLARVSPHGAFVAERGGLEILRSVNRTGMVVDIGQTSIKISVPGGARSVTPRDSWHTPHTGGLKSLIAIRPRDRLVEFIAGAVRRALILAVGPVTAVVVGLPCEISDGCVPGPSSYVALQGDPTIVPEAFHRAGLGDCSLLLVNDAELAAVSARSDSAVPAAEKVLVLTLGSGLGGALLKPTDVFLPGRGPHSA